MQDSQGVFTSLENSKGKPDSPRSGDTNAPEFYPPEVGPDTFDMKEMVQWYSITGAQLADITGALTWYKSDKGEWPDDWDDIINGYLLFLPANKSVIYINQLVLVKLTVVSTQNYHWQFFRIDSLFAFASSKIHQ